MGERGDGQAVLTYVFAFVFAFVFVFVRTLKHPSEEQLDGRAQRWSGSQSPTGKVGGR